jgi:MFS family permease
LIPIFLTQELGAPVYIVGFIIGFSESISNIFKVVTGWYSDKWMIRKPFAVAGYSLSAVSKAMMGLAYNWPMALVARVADRLGKGVRTSARDAMIADYTESAHRGKAFGLHRGFDSAGAAIGPLIAILLLSAFHLNLRTIFLLSFIPSIICVLLFVFFTQDSKNGNGAGNVPAAVGFKFGSISPAFNKFLLVITIFNLGNSSELFLVMRSQDLKLSLVMTTLIYVGYHMAYAIFAIPVGALADKIGPNKILLSGFVTFALTYALSAFIIQGQFMWIVFVLYGIYMAQTESVVKAYISNIVPESLFASAFGVCQFIVGICTFLASVVAGLLWTYVGSTAPFIFGSCTAIIAVILFLIIGQAVRSR